MLPIDGLKRGINQSTEDLMKGGFTEKEAAKMAFATMKQVLKEKQQFKQYPELQKDWQKAVNNLEPDLFFLSLEATNMIMPFVSTQSKTLARKTTIKSVKALRFLWFHFISIMLQNLETLEE